MKRPNLKLLPSKWNPFMLVIGVACIVLLAGYSYLSGKSETPAIATVQEVHRAETSVAGVGGAGSPELNSMMHAENTEKAEEASENGKSFIPIPVGSPKKASLLEETSTQEPHATNPVLPSSSRPQPEVSSQHSSGGGDRSKEIARLASYMETVRDASRLHGTPASYSFRLPERQQKKEEETPSPKLPGVETLAPGTILYASNDLTVSSDVTGTPVLATVVHGPLKGAKVMGKFTLSGERLVVSFQSITRDGITMPFRGFGVDPDKAEAGVASHVNDHTLLRWGSFIAASFLEGMGDALQNSGTTRYYNSFEQVDFKEKFNTKEQAQVAAGKVGERLADHLEKNLDMPPTVTLYAGRPLGILIVQ